MTRVNIVEKSDSNKILYYFETSVIPQIGERIRIGTQYFHDDFIVGTLRHELIRDTREVDGRMKAATFHDIYLICEKD